MSDSRQLECGMLDAAKLIQSRANRAYQKKARKGRASYLRMYEDALILLAWESGKLSEGQVSTALETDRISLRIMLCEAIDKGAELGGVLHDHNRKKRRRKEAALDAMGVKAK